MVKPKNKHSLSHVRHDPAHCLAPGLFRALKPVTEFAAGKYDITRPKAAGAPPPLYCKQDIFIFYIQWLIFLLIGNTMTVFLRALFVIKETIYVIKA